MDRIIGESHDHQVLIQWRREDITAPWYCSVYTQLSDRYFPLPAWNAGTTQSVLRKLIHFYDDMDRLNNVGRLFRWKGFDGQWTIVRRVGRVEGGAPLYLVVNNESGKPGLCQLGQMNSLL